MTELLTLEAGDLALSIDPQRGGRVCQLRFAERDLLTGPDIHPSNWGATFWTSPQADWGWPPVAAVDSEPYEVLRAAPDEVQLQSSEAAIGSRSVIVQKRFTVRRSGCFDAEYRIENRGSAPFPMACWEISRVIPGGLTFYPTGTSELTPIAPHGALSVKKADGMSYYDHGEFQPGRSLKLHADGQEGFVGQLWDDLLMLKLFEDSPAEMQAPGEGEVEIFANEDGRYVEVEVQGPYVSIPPGQSKPFVIRTHVAPAPEAVRGDRRELVACARERRRIFGEIERE